MKKNGMVLLLSTVFSASAWAGNGATLTPWYLGVGLAEFGYEEEFLGQDVEADLTALAFRVGYQMADAAAVEARFGFGLNDDRDRFSLNGSSYETDLEVDYYYGLYLKLGVPNASAFYPYVLLGFTEIQLDVGIPAFGIYDDESDSDTSYGLGVDFWLTPQFGLYAEYTNWYDKDDTDISGFNLGLSLRF